MPNTLREAYGQALRLTVGVVRFQVNRAVHSVALWSWLAVIIAGVMFAYEPYTLGQTLPYVMIMLCVFGVVSLYRRAVMRVRSRRARRENSRGRGLRITITVQ